MPQPVTVSEEARAQLELITQDNRQPTPALICPLTPEQLEAIGIDVSAPCSDNGLGRYLQFREGVLGLLNRA